MEWRLKRTVDPPELPVSVSEAKEQSRIDTTAEDALVERLINAAVDHIEGPYGIGVCMVEQTWELQLDYFPKLIQLPLFPVLTVEKIEYEDGDGVIQTVDSATYRVDTHSNPARISLEWNQSWPLPRRVAGSVTITFQAGYAQDGSGDYTANIPGSLRHAVLLLAAHWYEHREGVVVGTTASELPMAVESLISQYRVPGIA